VVVVMGNEGWRARVLVKALSGGGKEEKALTPLGRKKRPFETLWPLPKRSETMRRTVPMTRRRAWEGLRRRWQCCMFAAAVAAVALWCLEEVERRGPDKRP